MSSLRTFAGLDGLEKDEIAELLTQTKTAVLAAKNLDEHRKKTAAHGAARRSKKKDKQDSERLEEDESSAIRRLQELMEKWQIRPRPIASSHVLTAEGLPLDRDMDARRAIRRLYIHISESKKSSLVHENEEWKEQLKRLCQAVRGHLVKIDDGDGNNSELWVPHTIDPLPLQDLNRYLGPDPEDICFTPPPLLDESLENERAEIEESTYDEAGWKFYPRASDGNTMGRVLLRLSQEKKKHVEGQVQAKPENALGKQDELFDLMQAVALPEHVAPLTNSGRSAPEGGFVYFCSECRQNLPEAKFRYGVRNICKSCEGTQEDWDDDWDEYFGNAD